MAQEDLHYQLVRTHATALILQKLIDLRCEIRDCDWNTSRPTGFASPEGYSLAVSFDVIGGSNALQPVGAASFIVYGDDLDSIREAALFYGSTKYGANHLHKERIEDQSHIGRWVDWHGFPVEIVGIYPTWFYGDENPCNETMYISDKNNTIAASDLKDLPDLSLDDLALNLDY